MTTNMEHFRGEIEAVNYAFALRKGKIKRCKDVICDKCNFRTKDCVMARIKWLMAEYKPTPALTEREKHFVEFAETGWIVRDKNECVYWFSEEPTKESDAWWDDENLPLIYVGDGLFPFITWEDEEPWSVEELRKLEVEEKEERKGSNNELE